MRGTLRAIATYLRRHHVALLALFVALAGSSVAATNALLPKNSVGTAQVRNSSLQKVDFSKKAIRALKGNRGLRGEQGPTGLQGSPGIQGPPGPFPDAFPSGKTLRGDFVIAGSGNAGGNFSAAYGFGFRLSAAPIVHYIKVGTQPPADCPGSAGDPQATKGRLCVYEADNYNPSSIRGVCNPEVVGCPGGSANRDGFVVEGGPATTGSMYAQGSWAVTAP